MIGSNEAEAASRAPGDEERRSVRDPPLIDEQGKPWVPPLPPSYVEDRSIDRVEDRTGVDLGPGA
jgi:hypothetical protein